MGISQSNRNRHSSRSPRSGQQSAAPSTSAFDPSEHTVQEVLDYIDAHPDESAAVLAAEQAGKGRKTVLSALG